MAKLNGLYMFVVDEQASYGVDVTEHPVETGVSLTDHVKRNGITLSIRGELVGINTTSTLTKLRTMHNSGTVCKYVGRLTLPNCLITDMSVTATHKVWGGYEFTMTLKEIRTATTSYKKTSSTGNKAGTQQVTPKSADQYVYHTVKKGDCVWNLVAAAKAPYKNLSRPAISGKTYDACNWVMQMNPSAFSRKGDFGTLQIGKKLIVGVRSGATAVSPSSSNTNTAYKLTVSVTGTSSYIYNVRVNSVYKGKPQSHDFKHLGTVVISVDVGSKVQIIASTKDLAGTSTFSAKGVGANTFEQKRLSSTQMEYYKTRMTGNVEATIKFKKR